MSEFLGTELPVIQAPMAGVQNSKLAIAVCEAGGLGSLPCAMLDAATLRAELEALRATGRPYNLNFFCHSMPQPDPTREARWRERLEPYYREFGIDPASVSSGPGRKAFDAESAALLEQFKPPVVSFHFGLPPADLLDRVRASGAKVIASATTVAEAKWLAARGVDAIIAQGSEAGGHRGHFLRHDLEGQLPTRDLLQAIVPVVDLPLIAAGGIGDRESVESMLAAGAAAVQVGSAYLLCPEASTSDVHRRALQSEAGRHTEITNIFTGRPARGIVNRAMRELGPLNEAAPEFPLATAAMASLRSKAEAQGSGDFSPLWAGANAGTAKPMAAADLTRQLAGV